MAALQSPTWASSDENIRIKGADCIVVARVLGGAQWSEQQLFTLDNVARPGETVWVARVPMRPVLTLKGNPGSEFVFVESAESKLVGGGHGETMHFPHGLTNASADSLVLVWLHRPTANSLLPTRSRTDHYFRRITSQEMAYPDIEQIPVLPEANYISEGQTGVEKYCSILVQAYAKNSDAPHAVYFLEKMVRVKPWWTRENGIVTVSRPDMDGPGFIDFARSKLVPRLLDSQGTNTIRNVRAHYFAYLLAGDENIRGRHQQLIQEWDSTWQNPNEPGLVDGLVGSQEFMQGKLVARLASIRVAAVEGLAVKPENIALIVERLRTDEAAIVHEAAARWLQRLKMTDLESYRDAPMAKPMPTGGVENRRALIDYWSAR